MLLLVLMMMMTTTVVVHIVFYRCHYPNHHTIPYSPASPLSSPLLHSFTHLYCQCIFFYPQGGYWGKFPAFTCTTMLCYKPGSNGVCIAAWAGDGTPCASQKVVNTSYFTEYWWQYCYLFCIAFSIAIYTLYEKLYVKLVKYSTSLLLWCLVIFSVYFQR